MSIEERFSAACKVISNLPKDGPFQPSNDLKLTFYGYHKQATLGPCNIPKPRWWDIIGAAKWEAWKRLGNLPKQEAMKRYVEQLESIVETMSFGKDVEEFLNSGNSTMDSNDLQLALGPLLDKLRSESSGGDNILQKDESDTEDEEFSDPIEMQPVATTIRANGDGKRVLVANGPVTSISKPTENFEAIEDLVKQMRYDLDTLFKRIELIESNMKFGNKSEVEKRKYDNGLLLNLSTPAIVVIISWPIIVNFLFNYFKRRQ